MTTWWETMVRLIAATLLGGLVGWEREVQGKPAGFRTLMMVSVSACIFTLAATAFATQVGEPQEAARIMAGIAGGVGFLGAGAIMQARGEVLWLTTASALWAAAAIGMAVGLGMYLIAVAGGVLVYTILRWLALVEDRWLTREQDRRGEEIERRRRHEEEMGLRHRREE